MLAVGLRLPADGGRRRSRASGCARAVRSPPDSGTNISGNGHTVYYDATNSANSSLGGQTYPLAGGGTLKPA
jgi:hypothetical protein